MIWSAPRTALIARRDHHDRAPRVHRVELALDRRLGLGVDRRERVVEDQDRRVEQQRARERGALALSAREHHAALAHDRVVAVGQVLDVLRELRALAPRAPPRRARRRAGRTRCSPRAWSRTGTPPAAPSRCARRSVASGMRFTSMPSTKSWPSGTSKSRGIERGERALARAHRADHAERAAGGHAQLDVAQRGLALGIARVREGQVAELDLAAQLAQRHARRAGPRSSAARRAARRCAASRPRRAARAPPPIP